MSDARPWFGNVTTEVALDPLISTTAKAVYLALACHADMDSGECWVMNASIARHLGVHRRTVIRCINELIAAGALARVSRFRDGQQVSNLYTLLDVQRARTGGDTGTTPRGDTHVTQNNPSRTTNPYL